MINLAKGVSFQKMLSKTISSISRKIIKEFVQTIGNLKNFERNELEPIVQSLISKFDTNFITSFAGNIGNIGNLRFQPQYNVGYYVSRIYIKYTNC